MHPLVRDAVYHELSPAHRELMHARAAAQLRELAAPADQVASHLLSMPRRGERWVVDVLEEAARIAARSDLKPDWLNDAVKGYMSERGEFQPWLELDHLKVLVAQPEYLLAMKCLAFRIGAEFHDEDDVRFLLRLLDIRGYEKALEVIARYYPLERFPQKTLYALQELLPARETR